MTVAEQDDVWSDAVKSLPHRQAQTLWISKNMNHEDADSIELNHSFRLKIRRHAAFIDVAGNRRDGSKLSQLLKHLEMADVARVQNVLHPAEYRRQLRVEQSVGIGDDANDLFLCHSWFPP